MFPACCLCPGSGDEDSKPGRRNDAFWPLFTLFAGSSLAHPSLLPASCKPVDCLLLACCLPLNCLLAAS